MNPLSIQLDEEARRMAKVLAEKWGLPEQRFISRVLLRCLERVYVQEIGTEANKVLQLTGKGGEQNPVQNSSTVAAAFPGN